MQGVVLRERDQPPRVEKVEVDGPQPDEVLIRTAAAGICHSDVMAINDPINAPLVASMYGYPMVLGHESAGVVEMVGDRVGYVRPGDKVVTCLSMFCGACANCLQGRSYICLDRAALDRGPGLAPRLSQGGVPISQYARLGSLAELMLVHERAVVRIDPEMPLAPAALLGCGATTGLGAVFNTANVRPGETVAVIGCGGVGLCMVQAARIAGASRIIAIDPVRQRRELAYTLGATDTLDPSARDVHEDVMHLTGLGVDHALEAVGTPDSVSCALSLTCPGGSCTVAGAVMGHQLSIDGGLLLYARRLQGSILGSSNFRLDIPRYVDMYLAGQLRLDELITSRRSLAQVSEAFEDSARHVGIRALITFD